MNSGYHLSKELFNFIKSIGESVSKQEEDKIISAEAAILKSKISEPGITQKEIKEILIKGMYIEMLGHDASFIYIHAINLTNNANIPAKQVAYLTCASCLSPESPLSILLVANLQHDLQSPNYLEVSIALTAVCKLVNSGFAHAFNHQIIKLTSHAHEVIRKKSVIVLSKFLKMSPNYINDYLLIFKKSLCDKDPSVMGAALNCFYDISKNRENAALIKDSISSFSIIFKQVMDHRLSKDFEYQGMPGPWLQLRILEIFEVLGENDKKASQQMYEIVSDCIYFAEESTSSIRYAVMYQSIRTITRIYPFMPLIEKAAKLISSFVTSEDSSLRYAGINGLISIVKINPMYSLKHQMVVVDCLEDNDDTLKRKTLILLYKMANSQNVKLIVEKFTDELRIWSHDSNFKYEIVVRISELAEKFGSDFKWYIKTINSVLEIASDCIKPAVVNNLVKLIDECRDDYEKISFAIFEYFSLLKNYESVPDCLMQVSAWVLGEFSHILGPEKEKVATTILSKSLFKRFESSLTKGWILSALQKMINGVPSEQCQDLISKFSTSRNEDLQQRCYEFARVRIKFDTVPSFKNKLNLPVSFDFLTDYIQQDLIAGGKKYNSEKNRRGLKYLLDKTSEYKASDALKSMRMEAYQTPVMEIKSKDQESRGDQNIFNRNIGMNASKTKEIITSHEGNKRIFANQLFEGYK